MSELLVATGAVLARNGLEGLTVRAIAREADTTTMAIYSRLGGKDGIVEAINSEGFLVLNESFNKTLGEAEDDPERRILAYCRTLHAFSTTYPSHYRVMLGTPPDGYRRSAEALERTRAIWLLLRGLVARLVGEDTATMETYALFALCHGLIELEGGPVAEFAADGEAAFNASVKGALRSLRGRQSGAEEPADLYSRLNAADEPIEFGEPAWREETPRNAPCPCGSGKRYKHCHGAATL